MLIHFLLNAPDLLASTFELSTASTQTQTQDTSARFNMSDSGLLLSQPHVQADSSANINASNNTNWVRNARRIDERPETRCFGIGTTFYRPLPDGEQ
jgi:hypothetical protein